MPIVRSTAAGSLRPDSSSRSRLVRVGSGSVRSAAKTAAASVEETTAPRSSAVVGSRPISPQAARATTPAVIATPTVASRPAGTPTDRNERGSVPRPPSNRITASAAMAMFWASTASSKRIQARPSSATAMPSPRKSSKLGIRNLDVNPLAITPTRSNTPTSSTPGSTENDELTSESHREEKRRCPSPPHPASASPVAARASPNLIPEKCARGAGDAPVRIFRDGVTWCDGVAWGEIRT